jgi:hypothetical protein
MIGEAYSTPGECNRLIKKGYMYVYILKTHSQKLKAFYTKMIQDPSHVSFAVMHPHVGQYKEGTWTVIALI